MNKQRLNKLCALLAKLEEIGSELESIRDEEQEYVDNMPESLQAGEKAERANEFICGLDDIIGAIEESQDMAHL